MTARDRWTVGLQGRFIGRLGIVHLRPHTMGDLPGSQREKSRTQSRPLKGQSRRVCIRCNITLRSSVLDAADCNEQNRLCSAMMQCRDAKRAVNGRRRQCLRRV